MSYKRNPKTEGSGIVCSIPQEGTCPRKCNDCFFQSGWSYLGPLSDNLPNIPSYVTGEISKFNVVRINDGNDSNNDPGKAVYEASRHHMAFFNTAVPSLDFPGPVVLTVNPAEMTDNDFYKIDDPPNNLMFVRIRANTWNLGCVVRPAVKFYTDRDVPVILTFMAYYGGDSVPESHTSNYVFRKRTLNLYWAITSEAWDRVMSEFKWNKWVHSCGKIKGELGDTHCRFCGNCLREYFATITRMGLTR